MGKRHPNWRRIKSQRTYSTEGIAQTLGVHKNTVRNWVRGGLRRVDDGRPYLFRGAVIIDFLRARRREAKRPLQAGEIYCLSCRAPRSPALGMADLIPLNDKTGNLCGICPACDRMIYRRVSLLNLRTIQGSLSVTIREAPLRIRERT
jgi:hypothetical protein